MSAEAPRPRRSRKSIAFQPDSKTESKVSPIASESTSSKTARKSRSKSLGPGGLDALNGSSEKGVLKKSNINVGRRTSLAPSVKSILKPTLPLLPLAEIPAHKPQTRDVVLKQQKQSFTIPQIAALSHPPTQGTAPTTIPVRTEEEQQKRAEILAARAARRQSLGNRRVSFAPEATLHTWDVEYGRGDETPGSSVGGSSRPTTPSTGGRRRSRSSLSGIEATPTPALRPETSLDQVEHAPETPPNARSGHQKENRRSSLGIPPMNFNNPDDESMCSSPFSSSPGGEEEFVDHGHSSDSDETDSMDEDETSADHTFMSAAADTTMGENDTRMSISAMEVDTNMVDQTDAFQPAFKKPAMWKFEGETTAMHSSPPAPASAPTAHDSPLLSFSPEKLQEDSGDMTMEFTRPMGGVIQSVSYPSLAQPAPESIDNNSMDEEDMGEDMTMDMTVPLGRILASNKGRQSLGFPIQRPNQQIEEQDMTMDMDFTRPLGGIISSAPPAVSNLEPPSPAPTTTSEMGANEDMTMEFTAVFGGITGIQPQQAQRTEKRRSSRGGLITGNEWAREQAELQKQLENEQEEVDMDMTVAVGSILQAPAVNQTVQSQDDGTEEEEEDVNMDDSMDMTTAIGGILDSRQQENPESNATQNKPISAVNDSDMSAFVASPTPQNRRANRRSSTASTGRVTRRSSMQRKSLGIEPEPFSTNVPKTPTPQKVKPTTPVKTATPQPATPQAAPPAQVINPKPTTPAKPAPIPQKSTPVVSHNKPNTPSKRTPKPSTPMRPSSLRKSAIGYSSQKLRFESPFKATTPQDRAVSGLGIDQRGLGSPAVALKLAHRKSLGEDAAVFSPVAAPKALLQNLKLDARVEEQEKEEEKQRREDEIKNMDLRSRIQNLLSPKKQARKSMAYGALAPGKRAFGEAEQGGAKRRKSADGIGKIMRDEELTLSGIEFNKVTMPTPGSTRRTPGKTPRKALLSPKKAQMSPPKMQPLCASNGVQMIATKGAAEPEEPQPEEDITQESETENLSINEFLELIDISFLDDLRVTKSRHTGFVPASQRLSATGEDEEASPTDVLIAGSCTIPHLDLYMHSVKMLREYIKDGKSLVKEIEAQTMEANPLLFREYFNSAPDIRHIMDNQFKAIKTHSRLLARQMWYDWRTNILSAVEENLSSHLSGLEHDEELLKKQDNLLQSKLPELKSRYEAAKLKLEKVEEYKRRIALDSPSDLAEAREHLRAARESASLVRSKLSESQSKAEFLNARIQSLQTERATQLAKIEEAERVKEQNRGWTSEEVSLWRSRCEELERKSGWQLVSVLPDGRLNLLFGRELTLVCDPDGHRQPQVQYTPPANPKPSAPRRIPEAESAFFVSALEQKIIGILNPKEVLAVVAKFWKAAREVSENIAALRRFYHTIARQGDAGLEVVATVLVQELRSKMEVGFVVDQLTLETRQVGVRVVYGGIEGGAVEGVVKECAVSGLWRDGVREAVGRCLAGRRRGGVVVGVKA